HQAFTLVKGGFVIAQWLGVTGNGIAQVGFATAADAAVVQLCTATAGSAEFITINGVNHHRMLGFIAIQAGPDNGKRGNPYVAVSQIVDPTHLAWQLVSVMSGVAVVKTAIAAIRVDWFLFIDKSYFLFDGAVFIKL